jgi:orotidine-5'-phosphate decarboxylase
MDFLSKLQASWTKNNSLLCVGLDPDLTKLPEHLKAEHQPYLTFNKAIIETTADQVCAYKPNSAFYEARGAAGIEELQQTCAFIQEQYPEIPIILDFKRGDIGSTNTQYATFAFDYLGVDAVTINPYLGKDALQPFLDYKDKGIIVLCYTSNSGASEFQDALVDGQKLYQKIAENVAASWNANNNCALVVGANQVEELSQLRGRVGDDMVFLVPGIGAQGGNIEDVIKAGVNKQGTGIIVNSARDIIYSSTTTDFAEAARQQATTTRDEINSFR